MTAPFSTTPSVGFDLNSTVLGVDITAGNDKPDCALGTQVFGSNGKLFVYAQANAIIAASDTDCTVSATTFLATASGGAYLSPAVAMAVGDYGWFSKASV